MSAILFGSISTLADTSELQRDAFNAAFEQHGLDWHWPREDYLAMLGTSGGQSRIAAYADERGESVDATAVHDTKSKLFQQILTTADLAPREGVLDTIRQAKQSGVRVGLVTTTSRENITALLDALSPDIATDRFDVIVDTDDVDEPKPDRACFDFALERLGEQASDCVAIEDNIGGVQAALAAGVACVAFPNENTADHDFNSAVRRVDRLDFDDLRQLTAGN